MKRTKHKTTAGILITSFICLTAGIANSEANKPATFSLGKAPSAKEIQQWDTDIKPDGHDLPSGQGTIAQGQEIYQRLCQGCHGPEGKNGIHNQLVGKFDSTIIFSKSKKIKRTIGNFWPFATTLFDYINRAMPQNAPGSLNADQVYSLCAYLLHLNGIIDADTAMNAKTLAEIKMPAVDLFYWSDEVAKP